MDYWTAFILGLVGSLHCAGMCGPLALALPNSNNSRTTLLVGRVAYNLGRILTYCLLGVVFGLLGRTLFLAGVQRWVSMALGVAVLLGFFTSRKLARLNPGSTLVGHFKSCLSKALRRRSIASQALLGLLNGLLPCGLVYVAAAGAVATGGILASVGYMASFGAGTFPMMLAISVSGRLVPFSVRLKLSRAIPLSVLLLGSLLILRGMSLGIPYLSPQIGPGIKASCCHK